MTRIYFSLHLAILYLTPKQDENVCVYPELYFKIFIYHFLRCLNCFHFNDILKPFFVVVFSESSHAYIYIYIRSSKIWTFYYSLLSSYITRKEKSLKLFYIHYCFLIPHFLKGIQFNIGYMRVPEDWLVDKHPISHRMKNTSNITIKYLKISKQFPL